MRATELSVVKKESSGTTFSKLHCGDWFYYNGVLYIKAKPVSGCNSIQLHSGEFETFPPGVEVDPCARVEITIK